ncbi:MAG: MATE family efflux transporter [Clostridia bacterium]|nr:MATE family efflux transporter [Clostridia bacterium]
MAETLTEHNRAENKMGVMPIPKLLITMSLPIIISMLVQALYNIVDSIFVSQVDEYNKAFTAVSLAFPVQNLMIAVGAGTGVGINALLSKSLGEKNFEKANQIGNTGIYLGFFSFLAFFLFGIFGVDAYANFQTKDTEIVKYCVEYMKVICIGSLGIFMQITMERLLQSTGKSFLSMLVQLSGAIVNLIFDPILIFGYFGFPKMGVAGAALATVMGQFVSMGIGIFMNIRYNKELTISIMKYRPDRKTVGAIYAIAVPSILLMSIGSVMNLCMNKILIQYSAAAVAVFGVYFKLQSFLIMPVSGLNNGMVPIIAYNYGAKNKERIKATVRLSCYIACGIMFLGLAIFHLFPGGLLRMFNASADMYVMGLSALRIISLHYLFAGVCIIFLSFFQAVGSSVYSLLVSLGRQLVVLVPSAFLLSYFFGLDAVWWSFPLAEVISLLLSVIFMQYIWNKKIRPLS